MNTDEGKWAERVSDVPVHGDGVCCLCFWGKVCTS